MSDGRSQPALPVILMACGGILGAPGFFVRGEAGAIFLLPFGLGFALGGFLIARDYGGSVDWMLRNFVDRKGFRVPLAEGQWQTRVIGGGMCFIGAMLVIAGCAALLDALGVINIRIEG